LHRAQDYGANNLPAPTYSRRGGEMRKSDIEYIRNMLNELATMEYIVGGVSVEHFGQIDIDKVDKFHRNAESYVRMLIMHIDDLEDAKIERGGDI
jgi:hypothetical protein